MTVPLWNTVLEYTTTIPLSSLTIYSMPENPILWFTNFLKDCCWDERANEVLNSAVLYNRQTNGHDDVWTLSDFYLQCGQRYPGPCPHCPLCWAAIQSGSGTSQTQQVSAIRCQSVLLEHNEHMMWHSVMIMRYITYASICICNGRHWICTSKFGVLVLLWSGHSWASHLWTAFISEKNQIKKIVWKQKKRK